MIAATEVHGVKSTGAPFNVYLRNLKQGSSASGHMTSSSYAVKAGDTLTTHIPLSLFTDSGYSIEVVGANGFYRSFTGHAVIPVLEAKARMEFRRKMPTGNLQVHLTNRSTRKVDVTVEDNSYKSGTIAMTLNPGQYLFAVLNLTQSHGWYDFTVKTAGSSEEARYAGHIETGKPTFSDPHMGGTLEA